MSGVEHHVMQDLVDKIRAMDDTEFGIQLGMMVARLIDQLGKIGARDALVALVDAVADVQPSTDVPRPS